MALEHVTFPQLRHLNVEKIYAVLELNKRVTTSRKLEIVEDNHLMTEVEFGFTMRGLNDMTVYEEKDNWRVTGLASDVEDVWQHAETFNYQVTTPQSRELKLRYRVQITGTTLLMILSDDELVQLQSISVTYDQALAQDDKTFFVCTEYSPQSKYLKMCGFYDKHKYRGETFQELIPTSTELDQFMSQHNLFVSTSWQEMLTSLKSIRKLCLHKYHGVT